jgi:hypothetical protein
LGGHAARMFTPGAVMSGCEFSNATNRFSHRLAHSPPLHHARVGQRIVSSTLRMFGEMELGPLEEKYAIAGAGVLPTTVLLAEMCTVGRCLHVAHDRCTVRVTFFHPTGDIWEDCLP